MWCRFANVSEAPAASIMKLEDDDDSLVVVVVDEIGDDDWEDDGDNDDDDDDDDRGGSRFLRKVGVRVLLHSFTSQTTLNFAD